jgi:hypothetical protein
MGGAVRRLERHAGVYRFFGPQPTELCRRSGGFRATDHCGAWSTPRTLTARTSRPRFLSNRPLAWRHHPRRSACFSTASRHRYRIPRRNRSTIAAIQRLPEGPGRPRDQERSSKKSLTSGEKIWWRLLAHTQKPLSPGGFTRPCSRWETSKSAPPRRFEEAPGETAPPLNSESGPVLRSGPALPSDTVW